MFARDSEPVRKHRDGHCHEGVMWYVHHLPESLKEDITDKASLPLLSQMPSTMRILGGKSWDKVPGLTGSGKKFHRNVISGVDFTAGCSRSGAGLYVPRRTLSQGNVVIRSPPPGFDEGSYQGQSVPAPSQICHSLSLAKQHEEKVTCAS